MLLQLSFAPDLTNGALDAFQIPHSAKKKLFSPLSTLLERLGRLDSI